MKTRPVIGITKPEKEDYLAYLAIKLAVIRAGGRTKAISTGMSWRDTEVHGLIIGGGSDVFPSFYEQEAIEGARYDETRDEMEMYWARKARDNDIPTLAICRGAQIMNVAGGGTLHQDMDLVYEGLDYPSSSFEQVFYRKSIRLEADSLIRKIIGKAKTDVNSIHKQAIALVGADLVVTAREENGVVQAIEDPKRRFYLGVQFHPEFLTHRRKFRRIFQALVKEARLAA